MRSLLILSLSILFGASSGTSSDFIDPTGTYMLKGTVKNNRVVSHSGEMRVRLLDQHTVALCMYMNSGYPDYKSGAMIDTLIYTDNNARYLPKKDSACEVVFYFSWRKVDIMKVMSDPRSGCGFAPGVLESIAFSKISSEVPIIQDLGGRGN